MGYWSCHCDTFFIGNTKNVVAIKVVGIRIVKEIVTFRRRGSIQDLSNLGVQWIAGKARLLILMLFVG